MLAKLCHLKEKSKKYDAIQFCIRKKIILIAREEIFKYPGNKTISI